MAGMTVPGSTTGKTWRPDAGQAMSDSEYQAWRYDQASAGVNKAALPQVPNAQAPSGYSTQYPNTPAPGTSVGQYPSGPGDSSGVGGSYGLPGPAVESAGTKPGSYGYQNLTNSGQSTFDPYKAAQSLSILQGALGSGASAPTVSYGDAGADAARDATFARAKDKAGQIARASLTGLRNVMGERGLGGSSIESAQSAGILGEAGSELGDVNREQLIQDLNRQQHIQDLTYQGNITQRGQTLAAQNPQTQALLGLISAKGLY